ncbi:hypothetical protein G9A89_012176 [Geosiphon pyriformis]|nr:hypothetical protein G9A89_012176 [Geosiphon pyriformis]
MSRIAWTSSKSSDTILAELYPQNRHVYQYKDTVAKIAFWSKQKKNELLGAYGNYFEGFKLRSPTPSGFQSPPYQPDFGTVSLWEITELEEKKDEDQEFNYQNLMLKDPNIQTQQHLENSEIKTPNIRTPPNQRNQNPKLIYQPNLPSVIVINQPSIELIDLMAYAPIAKLDNFISKENDTQVWLNNVEKTITANRWNDAWAIQAILYFLKDTADS